VRTFGFGDRASRLPHRDVTASAFPVISVMSSDLCFIPDVEIDDGPDEEKRLAYLRFILLEKQREEGPRCTWVFAFSFSGAHAYGLIYVVNAEKEETRVWEVMNGEEWGRPKAGSRRSGVRVEPKPGQFVAFIGKGFTQLTPEDLSTALGELMANRVLSA
jgi:hypothetical protein